MFLDHRHSDPRRIASRISLGTNGRVNSGTCAPHVVIAEHNPAGRLQSDDATGDSERAL
jgi:hypothetical protein